jgi:putative endonuclease
MRRPRTYFVYILASASRRTYVGVTSNLIRRLWQHRTKALPGFTSDYNISSLVFFEATSDVMSAISREKEIKGWRRQKKIALIDEHNPDWRDLAEDLFE